MNKLWWVIFGLAAVIILLLLLDKPQQADTSTWQAEIHRKNTRIKELTTKHTEDSAKFAQELARLNAELKVKEIHTVKLERSIAKIKANPIIVKVRDSIKLVDDAFITYDSTLAAKNEEIRIQGKMIVSLEEENKRITGNFMERLNLQAQAFEDQKALTDIYKKDLRKARRNVKLFKVIAVVGAVGGLLLGSGL